MSELVRLDQWLWAARFYKTRTLAKAAIENGQVKVGGQKAKPSRIVHVGETIHIDKHGTQVYDVVVLICESKRASAAISRTFYQETEDSIIKRQELMEQHKMAREMVNFPDRRPDKHDRRKIRAFRHRDY